MKIIFRKSFERDLKKLKKNHQVLERIQKKIEKVEAAKNLNSISSIDKLSGGNNYFRIRVGNYRMGVKVMDNKITFIRSLHRREIYRYFP